jgi:hypothetical protein
MSTDSGNKEVEVKKVSSKRKFFLILGVVCVSIAIIGAIIVIVAL